MTSRSGVKTLPSPEVCIQPQQSKWLVSGLLDTVFKAVVNVKETQFSEAGQHYIFCWCVSLNRHEALDAVLKLSLHLGTKSVEYLVPSPTCAWESLLRATKCLTLTVKNLRLISATDIWEDILKATPRWNSAPPLTSRCRYPTPRKHKQTRIIFQPFKATHTWHHVIIGRIPWCMPSDSTGCDWTLFFMPKLCAMVGHTHLDGAKWPKVIKGKYTDRFGCFLLPAAPLNEGRAVHVLTCLNVTLLKSGTTLEI